MSEHISDDEQVEKLKAWWKNYGTALITGVVLGLALLYGGRYWNQLSTESSIQASMLYDQMMLNLEEKNLDGVKVLGPKLIEDFKNTPYAGHAALVLARMSYDEKDLKRAKAQLVWAMDNAVEQAVRDSARLRLATVLLAEKDYDAGLALLKGNAPIGFELEYYELLGDLYKGKGDTGQARTAYQKAVENARGAGEYGNVVRMKLSDLG